MNQKLENAFSVVDVIVKAVVGVSATLAVWFGQDMHADIKRLKEDRVEEAEKRGLREGRIVALESIAIAVNSRLERIETKLDDIRARVK